MGVDLTVHLPLMPALGGTRRLAGDRLTPPGMHQYKRSGSLELTHPRRVTSVSTLHIISHICDICRKPRGIGHRISHYPFIMCDTILFTIESHPCIMQ